MEIWAGGTRFIVDDDRSDLSCLTWYVHRSPGYPDSVYACRPDGRTTLYLHREVLGVTDSSILVDHVDGNTLDCRRANLREATPAQNQYNRKRQKNNTSGVKGVSWSKARGMWEAYISYDGRQRRLGYFDTLEQATNVRREAAERLHGEFARHE